MNYSTLTDSELIKYALIDAPAGSLAELLAQRFATNAVCLEDIEEVYADAINSEEREHATAIRELEAQLEAKEKRIEALEEALETERDSRPDPLLS
jgi:vacuolar-type H+-ATPase subunit E/Vma4